MIRSFVNYQDHNPLDPRPWLVIGSGPSFDRFDETMIAQYRTMAIHRTNAFVEAEIGLFIDYEPLIACTGSIRARHLFFPWVPHWRERPLSGNLEVYLRWDTVLQRHAADDTLFAYDMHSAPEIKFGEPIVRVYNSTAQAAFDILGVFSAKKIYTLGIDGGGGHASSLPGYEGVQNTYSEQFDFLEFLRKDHGMTVVRL